MIVSAEALGLFLKLMLLRAGGQATITLDQADGMEHYTMFMEGTEDGEGIVLSIAFIGDDESAGHA